MTITKSYNTNNEIGNYSYDLSLSKPCFDWEFNEANVLMRWFLIMIRKSKQE